MKLSHRINNIEEPQTIGMAQKSRELKAQGVDMISLSLGEPDFTTPDIIKLAAKKSIDENFSYYTHVSGYIELRQAIAKKFKRDNNLDYQPEQIVVSTGAKQSIANAMLCLVNPGEEVIVPAPYWVTYPEQVKLAEGKSVILPTKVQDNFKITPQQLKNAITSKTRLIVFSSPCNPTGSVYTKEELKAIAEVIVQYPELYVISDEIYEHINFIGKHESIAQFDAMKERTIVVNGASKSFAMTGWRVGYLAAPLWIAKACDKIQGQFTSATCSIAQKAMHCAAELDVSIIYPMRDAFKRRRDLVYELLKEIPGVKTNFPNGAFYFFPDISYYLGKKNLFFREGSKIKSSSDLCMYLLEKGHVALVPGDAFGDDNHIRISYAAAEDKLMEAMKRIKKALGELE
ncbi:MAG: pyridoxal phosphate-dependent aminotransferase [Bacteroidota bacterium]